MVNKEAEGVTYHPEGLTKFQEWFLERFFDAGGLEFGEFAFKLHERIPDAPMSNNQINFTNAAEYENLRFTVAKFYMDVVSHNGLDFDLFAAVPTSSVPFVEALSEISGIKMVTPQIKNRGAADKVIVSGISAEDKGKIALVVDDVITGADSKLKAIEVLRDSGIGVRDVMVAIDRDQGGRAQLEVKGYNLYSVMTLSQMLSFYRRVARIDEETYRTTSENIKVLGEFLKSH